ncbi:MAG: penicillin-binding protein activator [Burkholderiaceae bacterium]|nr:penicillin-binding protein activator [Burkholderiaceae bacterium]MEB2320415.1 penicillin-binding protein activator [Pseudomonadota bacterium]
MKRRSLLRVLGSGASVVAAARAPGVTGLSMLAGGAASAATRFGRGDTRIALLLPDDAGPFRRAAEAVLMGVQAAHELDGAGVMVESFDVDDERTDLPGLLQRIAGRGYSIAVGPITRTGVNRLAEVEPLPLPVLTLNVPEPGYILPAGCVQFGLPIEDEAAQIARFAIDRAMRQTGALVPRAIAIADQASSLAHRSAGAFLDAWRGLGGESYDMLTLDTRMLYELPRILGGVRADAAFVALSPEAVPVLREALGPETPLYGTSRLDVGAIPDTKAGELLANPALDGLHIVEMPWQVERRHPAVAAYPRSEKIPHLELQRLYALGIDAYRIARELVLGRQQIEIDGVTGWLRVDVPVDPRVQRISTVSVYQGGMLVPAEIPAAQPAPAPAGPAPAVPGGPAQPLAPADPTAPAQPWSPGQVPAPAPMPTPPPVQAPPSPGFVPVPAPTPAPGGFAPMPAPSGFTPVPAPASGFVPVPAAPPAPSQGFVPVPPPAGPR